MSARRMPNKALLALSALSLSSLVQAYICTLSTTSMMASAAGPALRPIPESTQKPVSEKPKAEKEAAKTTAADTGKNAAKTSQKPLTAVAQPLVPAKSAATTTINAKTKAEPASTKAASVSAAPSPLAKSRAKVNLGRASMVPPPPPNTPSMLSDPSMMGLGMGYGAYGMQVEYMSREALKDRVKELSIQVKDASAEFESRKRLKTEREARAKSFEQLYTEGVVSRRELENSQREATDSTDEVQRLEHKYKELSSLLERVNKRLAAFPQPASRKSNQKAQQKLKKSQAKVIAPAKEQIKAADSKLIN
ncbi:MAG: hypothetical protein WC028_18535 [Candidatus Obscuribacterales bacterium]